MTRPHLLVTVIFCLFFITLPLLSAHADLVWDDELNRYLTPEEMGHEEIFLTPDEASKLIFSESEQIRQANLILTPAQKNMIQERIGWEFPETSFECFIGETKGKTDGWALIQNTIGKHKHMTYMVGVDLDGEVMSMELLVFREARGSEVGKKRFSYQYEGKTVYDPIRINRDIINISGATMSVRSMSAGIKRVLVVVDEIYLKPMGRGSKITKKGQGEKSLFETLLGF